MTRVYGEFRDAYEGYGTFVIEAQPPYGKVTYVTACNSSNTSAYLQRVKYLVWEFGQSQIVLKFPRTFENIPLVQQVPEGKEE